MFLSQKAAPLVKLGEHPGSLAGGSNDVKTDKNVGAKPNADTKDNKTKSKLELCKETAPVDTNATASTAEMGKEIGATFAGEEGGKMGESAGAVLDVISDPKMSSINASLGENIGYLAGGEKGKEMGGTIGSILETVNTMTEKNITYTAKLDIKIIVQSEQKTSKSKTSKTSKTSRTSSKSSKKTFETQITSTAKNEGLQFQEATIDLSKAVVNAISGIF